MLPSSTPRFNRLQGRSPIRQTVLSGPKSLGLPDFLEIGTGLEVVTAGLTVEPLYFTIGKGYRNGYQDDLLMSLNSNLAVSLPDNEDRIFLYLEVDLSGDVTLNYTLLDIDLNIDKPSTPAMGQFNYPFDHSGQGTYYNGSTWQQAQRLFIGECTTSAGVVTNIEHYSYNRNAATQYIFLNGSGDFTGGIFSVSRLLGIISLGGGDTYTHTNLTSVISDPVVPEWASTSSLKANTYFDTSNLIARFDVLATREIRFVYRDETGTSISRADTVIAPSLTYHANPRDQ